MRQNKVILKFQLLVLGWLCCLPASSAVADSICANCPRNGQAVSASIGIFLTRTNGSVILPGDSVGACESVVVHTDLGYKAAYPGGIVGAGYFGGTAIVSAFPGDSEVAELTVNVTPPNLATTRIGPVAPAPNACADTDDLLMDNLTYTFTAADIAAGSVRFRFDYTGGTALIVPCKLRVSSSAEASAEIAPSPSCSVVASSTNISYGVPASLNVNATGTGPFTYCWQKSSDTASCLSTNATLMFTNVQTAEAGVYVATVTDRFGCVTTCTGTLIVHPHFTSIEMSGLDLILSGGGGASNGLYTVLAATNVDTSAVFWTPIATNQFDTDGLFTFTNRMSLTDNRRYFRLQIP